VQLSCQVLLLLLLLLLLLCIEGGSKLASDAQCS